MRRIAGIAKRHWLAVVIIAFMTGLSLWAMAVETPIIDEIAHIPAGYSMATKQDYRLNPEHPPLQKTMSGIALAPFSFSFPSNDFSYKDDVNGQWETGWSFLYRVGNNADQLLFVARLPILLCTVIGAGVLYAFCFRRFGKVTALMALVFYAFCPTILAHGHLVTTDMGLAVTTVIALITLVRFIEKPTGWRLVAASAGLALALITKFSAVLLVPVFIILLVMAAVVKKWPLLKTVRQTFWMLAASLAMVWVAYIPVTLRMPIEKQDALITQFNQFYKPAAGTGIILSHNHLPLMKPLAHYLLGFNFVFTRLNGGNIVYFMGNVSNQSFRLYFPVTYLLKTPPALIVAMMLSIILFVKRLRWRVKGHPMLSRLKAWVNDHWIETAFTVTAAGFWASSILGNLNLGIRHILPAIVLMSTLVAIYMGRQLKQSKGRSRQAWKGILTVTAGWYVFSALIFAPNFLPYISELAGGPANANKYLSDSNVDWGQDMKKLIKYVDAHPEMGKVGVDYFGGGMLRYYTCGYEKTCEKLDRFQEWHAEDGIYPGQYLAVSENYLMNDLWYAPLRGDKGLSYVRDTTPVARVGYSIYVYKVR